MDHEITAPDVGGKCREPAGGIISYGAVVQREHFFAAGRRDQSAEILLRDAARS